MKNITVLLFVLVFVGASCKNSGKNSNKNYDSTLATKFLSSAAELKWTAFKTPDKVGVSGTFKDVKMEGNRFVINTASVSSGDASRDEKLKKYFFENLTNMEIIGTFGLLKEQVLPVIITMNGMEKTVYFKYSEEGSKAYFKGKIDIVNDFMGNIALEALNKACYDLHAGKTWSEVDLEVSYNK